MVLRTFSRVYTRRKNIHKRLIIVIEVGPLDIFTFKNPERGLNDSV